MLAVQCSSEEASEEDAKEDTPPSKRKLNSSGRKEIKTSSDNKDGDMFGRQWSKDEHDLFIVGLRLYGKRWTKISSIVPTRTAVQTRTHARNYFEKLDKMRVAPQKYFKKLDKMRVALSKIGIVDTSKSNDPKYFQNDYQPEHLAAKKEEHRLLEQDRKNAVKYIVEDWIDSSCPSYRNFVGPIAPSGIPLEGVSLEAFESQCYPSLPDHGQYSLCSGPHLNLPHAIRESAACVLESIGLFYDPSFVPYALDNQTIAYSQGFNYSVGFDNQPGIWSYNRPKAIIYRAEGREGKGAPGKARAAGVDSCIELVGEGIKNSIEARSKDSSESPVHPYTPLYFPYTPVLGVPRVGTKTEEHKQEGTAFDATYTTMAQTEGGQETEKGQGQGQGQERGKG